VKELEVKEVMLVMHVLAKMRHLQDEELLKQQKQLELHLQDMEIEVYNYNLLVGFRVKIRTWRAGLVGYASTAADAAQVFDFGVVTAISELVLQWGLCRF
jgi:hypothetical protein